jgi:F-type H+-transporting ATPase subunit c
MLAESPEQGAAAGTPAGAEVEKAPLAKGLGIIGASLGAGLAVAGGAFGIARIGAACVESIARQPEAGGAMFAPMVVAAAMVEGGMLFAILVCMLGVFRT